MVWRHFGDIDALILGAALSWGVFKKVSRILDLRVSFDGE